MKWKSRLKVLLKWRQPEAFRVAEDKRSVVLSKPWLRPLCVCVFVGSLSLDWRLHRSEPNNHAPDYWVCFLGSLGLALGLLYGLPWLLRRAPSTVELCEGGVRATGDEHMMRYRDIAMFAWVCEDSYYVLDITTRSGRHRLYGVPDLETKSEIESILRLKMADGAPLMGVRKI